MTRFNQTKRDRVNILFKKNLRVVKKYVEWKIKHADVKVLSLSVPKAGTNMTEKILEAMPGLRMQIGKSVVYKGESYLPKHVNQIKKIKPGTYVSAHLPHRPEIVLAINDSGVKCLVTVRDPRAVFCSLFNYLESMDHTHLASRLIRSIECRSDKFQLLFNGYPGVLQPFNEILEDYLCWLEEEAVHVVRFEDTVGPIGGRPADIRLTQIQSISDFLGVVTSTASAIDKKIDPNDSSTLRAPSIDGWKDFFSNEEAEFLDNRMGSLITDFGYNR